MTDIVERLRDWMTIDQTTSPASRMAEAAYEIESLRQQLADIKREWATADSHKEDYAEKLEQQLAECKLCLAEIVRISDRKHDAWDRAKQLLAMELE